MCEVKQQCESRKPKLSFWMAKLARSARYWDWNGLSYFLSIQHKGKIWFCTSRRALMSQNLSCCIQVQPTRWFLPTVRSSDRQWCTHLIYLGAWALPYHQIVIQRRGYDTSESQESERRPNEIFMILSAVSALAFQEAQLWASYFFSPIPAWSYFVHCASLHHKCRPLVLDSLALRYTSTRFDGFSKLSSSAPKFWSPSIRSQRVWRKHKYTRFSYFWQLRNIPQ